MVGSRRRAAACAAVALWLLCTATPGHGMAYTVFQAAVEYYRMLGPKPADAVPDAASVNERYDFVVVGAGSGGSVVANRLTEVAGWTVLLLEAGDDENAVTDVPLLVSYLIGTTYDWNYRTEPEDGVCGAMVGRRCRWPRGKTLGGTSVINYMVYTRGTATDYDGWARLGNTGWSYADVLPYFIKSERVRQVPYASSSYHGRGGYLAVERPEWRTPLGPAFLRAGRELGYRAPVDHSGPRPLGFSYVLATTDRGTRCSAAKAFLRPVRNRPNLTVSKRSLVTKILIDPITKRARGVRFVKDGRPATDVFADKEVIVCAGALNSPQLLMLSGIGPADHLAEVGVPVISDLKVGHNLQDHVSMSGLVFLVNQSVTIVESRYRNPKYLVQYALAGRGPYTVPGGAEAVAFTTTRHAAGAINGSAETDMELVFGPGALTGDTGGSLRRLLGMNETFYSRVYGQYAEHDAWGLVPVLLRPRSRGRVKLRSADPLQPPLFYSGYLTDRRDRLTLVEGIKQAIAVSQTPAFQKYGSTLLPVPFPGCEHEPFGSDAYWWCATGLVSTNLHHQSGTCKMGPDTDPDAVVDPRLRVRGVRGLRVVDTSIMPVIPAGHTNAMAFMIGEKASDMIKDDWRPGMAIGL